MSTTQRSAIAAARLAWADRTEPESRHPLARGFWHGILLLTAATFAVQLLAAGWFFYQTLEAIAPPADQAPIKRTQKLDRAQLDQVNAQLTARTEAFNARKLPVTAPPDPSI